MDTVDDYVKQPPRKLDAPFLLAIEHVHMIKGRGTVVTDVLNRVLLKLMILLNL